jgi:hypothetical protein
MRRGGFVSLHASESVSRAIPGFTPHRQPEGGAGFRRGSEE